MKLETVLFLLFLAMLVAVAMLWDWAMRKRTPSVPATGSQRAAMLACLLLAMTGCVGSNVQPTPAASASTVTVPLQLPPDTALPASLTHDVTAICTGINIAGIAISMIDATTLGSSKLMNTITADFADVQGYSNPICSGDTTAVSDDVFRAMTAVALRAHTDVVAAERAGKATAAPAIKK